MKNLIIIPARRNSKRVKNKNLIKVLNKPLIFWTINYAKKFNKKIYDIVVSSDCNKIKKICDKEKVNFLKRPKKISDDYTSMHEVILHAKNFKKQNYKYMILLQPTSPLRKLSLLNRSIKILNDEKSFDSLIHVAKDSSFTGAVKNKIWKPEFSYNKRSQDINNKYVVTGNLYIYKAFLYSKTVKIPRKTYSLISSDERWIDIDNKEDFKTLNFYLNDTKIKKILVKSV